MESKDLAEATESTAYSVLQYCITQAVLRNRSVNSKFQIPYNILKKPKDTPYDNVSLEVEIKLTWTESDIDPSVEIDYE